MDGAKNVPKFQKICPISTCFILIPYKTWSFKLPTMQHVDSTTALCEHHTGKESYMEVFSCITSLHLWWDKRYGIIVIWKLNHYTCWHCFRYHNVVSNIWIMLFQTSRSCCFKHIMLNTILALHFPYELFHFLPPHLYKDHLFSSMVHIHPFPFFCKACHEPTPSLNFHIWSTFYHRL